MITLDSIDHTLHSIKIGDGTEIASVTAANQLEVAVTAALPAGTNNIGDVDVLSVIPGVGATNLGKAEDAAHSSGDVGVMGLAVRNDAGTALAADGDYIPLIVNSAGHLWVAANNLDIRDLTHVSDSVKIGDGTDFLAVNADGSINAQFTEAGYASWLVSAETVDTTAGGVQLVATPLTGRLRVEIQNLGSQDIYIAEATGVTVSSGLKVPKGSSYEQALDAGAEIWAITPSGTSDVRVAEYAA